MDIDGKKVLVVGLAASGRAACLLLIERGAIVTATDNRSLADLSRSSPDQLERLRSLGVEFHLEAHPDEVFTRADLIVASPGVPSDLPQLVAARRHGVPVISEVELASRFLRGRLIGITGSNGKTTTTALTGELLRAIGCDVLVGGNIGNPLSALVGQSTADSWTVAELSSFQLEAIETLRPQVAVITNVTPDHLDRHGTFDDYVRAKHRIFRNQAAGDFAVLNADSAPIVQMVQDMGIGSTLCWFSRHADGALSPSTFVKDGAVLATIFADCKGEEVEVLRVDEIPLPGAHNVENVLAALGASICAAGAGRDDAPRLGEAVRSFKGVEHRIEFVAEIRGVRYYNDSKATNVDSTIKALEAFDGNVILILGGKDKGSDYSALGDLIAARVKHVLLIGAAGQKIAGQLGNVRPMEFADSLEKAVGEAAALAEPGDTVLLSPACASFDMFENYEHRGRVFKEAVNEIAMQAVAVSN